MSEPTVSPAESPSAVNAQPAEGYSKKNPFPAPLLDRFLLNGRGSAKETIHLELSLAGSGLGYKPGDSLAVIPANAATVVADLLQLAGWAGNTPVAAAANRPLAEVLTREHDITSLNPVLMRKYAALAGNAALAALLLEENKEQLSAYLYGREFRDLFADFPPAAPLAPDAVLGMLRKMPPRLYSIASSLRAHPDEVHLTVGVVRYEAHGHQRLGVCSTYLAERVDKGATIPVYVHQNKNFFLPDDPTTPIIMVGPGTGIAPFRAFIEERAATGATGRSWLFFGDQHLKTDFLYQTEWQQHLKSGALGRLDVAFSRDTDRKVYVQHRMQQAAAELYAWLAEGAYFYVCGEAARMAKDVHQTLIDIIAEHGGKTAEEAEAAVKDLQKQKRYQRDVY